MKKKVAVALVLLLGAMLFAGASECMAASESAPTDEELCLIDFKKIPRLTIDELKSRLGDSSLVIIDVRSSADWSESSIKIKGAVREVYANAEKWASKYDKNKTIVLYCAWPDEGTSARAAQILIGQGFKAKNLFALKGGWKEWEKAGYPTDPK